jgi:mono/diheme cytochrome c family protein
MATHLSARVWGPLGGAVILLSLGAWQLVAPPAVHAQADASGARQRPVPPPSAPAADGAPAARDLFRQHCAKCHGASGTGRAARGLQTEIPDFTDASWQARRSEAQFLASILDGKGQDMPSFRGKINEDQARDLAAYVRTFAPTTARPGPGKKQGPNSASGFAEEFRRLQKEMDELQRQFRQLSKESPDRKPSKPAEPPQQEGARPHYPASLFSFVGLIASAAGERPPAQRNRSDVVRRPSPIAS